MALTNVFNLPTIATILQQYQDTVQSINPNANPYVARTDWYVKGQALSGIVSGAYADIAINAQNIYPQYATGNAVDLTLAEYGLPPRLAATYASGTAYYNNPTMGAFPFTIAAGSTLTNSTTGAVYTIYATTTVTFAKNIIQFLSNNIGIGYQLNVGTNLTLSPTVLDNLGNPVTSLLVFNSADGSEVESDSQAVQRILSALQNPPAGARVTDYYNFALEGNNFLSVPEITNAIIIPAFLRYSNLAPIMGIFGLAGSIPNDYLLNLGFVTPTPDYYSVAQFMQYNRTLSADGITAIQDSIFSQKLIALNLTVSTTDTWPLPLYGVNPVIQVTVTLVSNITLATTFTVATTDQFGNPTTIILTALQLIQRETRRAIVNTPFLGVIDNMGNHFIPVSSIEQSLDYGLGAGNINGIYASILANRSVAFYNGTSYSLTQIPVPTYLNPLDGNVFGIYDFAPYNGSNDPYNENVMVVAV